MKRTLRQAADGSDRRRFLADAGMGVFGMALGAMLAKDGLTKEGAPNTAMVPRGVILPKGRAKSVIWLFMVGGASQMETFDPKPALNTYAGKTIAETPLPDPLQSEYLKKNLREIVVGLHKPHPNLYPLQVGYSKRGESGIEMSDWWPHLGTVVDDLAIVRSMWTTDNNHGAQLQFHTGRHVLEGQFPTVGSWCHYGMGSLNDDLPQFVVLGTPIADCCGGIGAHGASYLGPEHDGVQLSMDPTQPLPFATPAGGVSQEEQRGEFELLRELHAFASADRPEDARLQARVRSYELAYRMQMAVPEAMTLSRESAETLALYGVGAGTADTVGRQCLVARRLVERGVRFVQIFHGSNGGAGEWDAHGNLQAGHSALCQQVDQPIAGLIADLKRRGMLEETLVVWGTEFGRTPGAQNSNGRDHHPYGFSVWLAGGGVKGGVVHGATDEIGFHAVEHRHYVTDLHATVLHQLGLDSRKLEIPGRKRLDIDHGKPITEILA